MPWGKRRKGKQGSGRSAPSAPSTQPPPDPEEKKDSNKEEGEEESKEKGPKEGEEQEEAKQEEKEPVKEQEEKPKSPSPKEEKKEDDDLVLTSEKRRGVYECDYCHSDISQLPRIRCAVCADFDLCLDCFATTDHSAAIARLKAATTAHSELEADGIASTMVTGISSAAANHDHTHGYRVCDSTRYPIFGLTRSVTRVSTEPAEDVSAKMDVDDDAAAGDEEVDPSKVESVMDASIAKVMNEDPKNLWTAEEDLRLLDAIKTHGLGNWADISEAVGGYGSVGKTPKRCMERYFDDFLGRYGHILPAYTIVDDNGEDEDAATHEDGKTTDGDDSVRASKRRLASLNRASSNLGASSSGGRSRKRFKVVPTESLPGFDQVWTKPYLPAIPGVQIGQEVARDLSLKAELSFVKATTSVSTKAEADKIRKEWEDKGLGKIGSPTVLPPRPEDSATLPGADLVGFMPRRGDFDIEWENDAEQALADMEFTQGDSPQDKELKLQVLEIYYQKQNEREKRKKFILSRKLYDYRKYMREEEKLPLDERDLKHRMLLFERFHTPEEHKVFLADIMKAKRLRKEIAKLQMYRRIGIRSLLEAEKYELDKSRRQFHKLAQLQKEAEAKEAKAPATAIKPAETAMAPVPSPEAVDSLWKQYRTSDRKARRSINRAGISILEDNRAATTIEDYKTKISDKTKDESLMDGKQEVNIQANPPSTPEVKNENSGEDSEEGKDSKMDLSQTIEEDETKVDENKDLSEGNSSDTKEVGNEETTKEENDKDDDKMEIDGDGEEFCITDSKGFELLSPREAALCVRLKIFPAQYLEIKKALIHESLVNGLLEKEGGRRMVVKIDVERRGDIIDFMVRAGWISNKLGNVARSVTPISAAE